ncbi:MAG TPA: AI-2E family transporter [Gammaproteobacteria bacterium]|nr:AI-2E family transporter [Gammaproteobacteria bacterium]
MNLVANWFRRTFSDPQVVALILALVTGFTVILFFGGMLAPVLASLVIAYLLEGVVGILERYHLPRLLAVSLVFIAFMLFVALVIFGVLPLASSQLTELVQQLPYMLSSGQKSFMRLPELYPDLVTAEQITRLITVMKNEVALAGQKILSISASSVVGLITLLVYLILVPLLVFFFMKDKELIVQWFLRFFPKDRGIADQVWIDVDIQIANYVRGKFWEVLIVGSVSYVTFTLFGLNYALLLGVLVGLSVIIPYVGAAVVTLPVLLVAWFQWGWGGAFGGLAIAYFVIQALDGNVLVPLLFSEVVNLHPVAIIVSILVFGGLWGFWGVFFAIPLGTLVKAVLTAWPSQQLEA